MFITTPARELIVICDEATAEHLVPNLLNFDIEGYTTQKMTGGSAKIKLPIPTGSAIVKCSFYCRQFKISPVYEYLKDNYIDKYPVLVILNEVSLPY